MINNFMKKECDYKSPFERWNDKSQECFQVCWYCRIGNNIGIDDPIYLNKIYNLKRRYGEPTPELHKKYKDILMEEFLKYWETL